MYIFVRILIVCLTAALVAMLIHLLGRRSSTGKMCPVLVTDTVNSEAGVGVSLLQPNGSNFGCHTTSLAYLAKRWLPQRISLFPSWWNPS